ncbi:MAG: hypothetical protein NXH85_01840 [Pseudomonadaceae bacterium]|nr:hypothetical protein [Pseudomonadaceae bacterium]
MTRIRRPAATALILLVLLSFTACSDSAPDVIELTYRDRCPASDTPVALISMEELARLSGAKLLNAHASAAPLLIRVNAPESVPAGQGLRLQETVRDDSTAIATFIATEAKNAQGNACSVLTIAPDAQAYNTVVAMFEGEQIGAVELPSAEQT